MQPFCASRLQARRSSPGGMDGQNAARGAWQGRKGTEKRESRCSRIGPPPRTHLHRDELLLGLHDAASDGRIHVQLGHVVDDHGDAQAMVSLQNALQKRRLASTQEAAQDSDGQRLDGRLQQSGGCGGGTRSSGSHASAPGESGGRESECCGCTTAARKVALARLLPPPRRPLRGNREAGMRPWTRPGRSLARTFQAGRWPRQQRGPAASRRRSAARPCGLCNPACRRPSCRAQTMRGDAGARASMLDHRARGPRGCVVTESHAVSSRGAAGEPRRHRGDPGASDSKAVARLHSRRQSAHAQQSEEEGGEPSGQSSRRESDDAASAALSCRPSRSRKQALPKAAP